MNSSDVPDLSTTFLKTASAVGLRQMFPTSHICFMLKVPAGAKKPPSRSLPRHTKSTLVFVMSGAKAVDDCVKL